MSLEAENDKYDYCPFIDECLAAFPLDCPIRTISCTKCSRILMEHVLLETPRLDHELLFHYLFTGNVDDESGTHHYNHCTFESVGGLEKEENQSQAREICEEIAAFLQDSLPNPDVGALAMAPTIHTVEGLAVEQGARTRRKSSNKAIPTRFSRARLVYLLQLRLLQLNTLDSQVRLQRSSVLGL